MRTWTNRRRRGAALVAVVVAATSVAAMAAVPAGAKTITTCVNKRTGEMRLRSGAAAKRRCAKGWRKVSWTTTGKQGAAGTPGATGPAGPAGPAPSAPVVKDATGATVGQLLAVGGGPVPIYTVLRDGGVYDYLPTGQVWAPGSPYWKDNACAGTAYFLSNNTLDAAKLAASSARFVERQTTPVYGPLSAWKFAGTRESVATASFFVRNTAGACVADPDGTYTGEILTLTPVAAPPDVTGPLALG